MNRMNLGIISALLLCSFLIASCNSNEIGSGSDVNPESIYFDYKIWGEEGNDHFTVMLQYRFAGPHGTTLLLEEPSKVELDGVLITADSSKMTGAYYEELKPINEFSGKHKIVFTDMNGKTFTESFSFSPITIRSPIPGELKREDLVIGLDGLDSIDFVRVLMMDTTFESMGINWIDTIRNGTLTISKELLRNVVNGPIHLELYREVERPLKERTKEGGRLSITYGLKRDFVLMD